MNTRAPSEVNLIRGYYQEVQFADLGQGAERGEGPGQPQHQPGHTVPGAVSDGPQNSGDPVMHHNQLSLCKSLKEKSLILSQSRFRECTH